MPASVTVPAAATSATFTANVASVTSTQSATLTATTGSTSKAVSLQLNAASATLSLSATSLSFGNVSVGTAVTKSVTVTSSGTVAVTINSDSTSGTGFSVSGGSFPVTLNPGQATVLTVQFDPTTASSATGQLTISSNAPAATVSLSGTGTTTGSNRERGHLQQHLHHRITGGFVHGEPIGFSAHRRYEREPCQQQQRRDGAEFRDRSGNCEQRGLHRKRGFRDERTVRNLTATTGSTSKALSLQLNAGTPTLTPERDKYLVRRRWW